MSDVQHQQTVSTSNHSNNDNEDPNTTVDVDDSIEEINILPSSSSENANSPETNHRLWTDDDRQAYEERRREALNQELNRVQRTNFIHFMVLCMIPVFLIVMVLLNSFIDDGDCIGYGNLKCWREARNFLNGYSNSCICEAFNITSSKDEV